MNLPTLIILLILAAIVGCVVRKLIKDKKAGKCCGGSGGCAGCGGSAMCHGTGEKHGNA